MPNYLVVSLYFLKMLDMMLFILLTYPNAIIRPTLTSIRSRSPKNASSYILEINFYGSVVKLLPGNSRQIRCATARWAEIKLTFGDGCLYSMSFAPSTWAR
jgi:hypothetical protein